MTFSTEYRNHTVLATAKLLSDGRWAASYSAWGVVSTAGARPALHGTVFAVSKEAALGGASDEVRQRLDLLERQAT